jgi:16S rRNA (uracil1498-N3)-methyltransferase
MSCPWFHAAHLPAPGDVVALDREEAKHALGVRRLGAGDGVTLFDGRGGAADAAITGDRDRDGGVLARVTAVRSVARPEPDVLVGIAPPKGDRWSTALDMLGQLGVAAIVPLDAAHGVVDASGINRARAERILLESCKQSRGAWLPELRAPQSLAAFVASARAEGRRVLLAQPGGAAVASLASRRVAIAIGPEGGFSAQEIDAALAAGAEAADLGTTILRVETAAVAMAAALRLLPVGA